jgi:hypothetical protein
MKLIEKKCPNCGASLSFSETDKSCKCEYCHREFEIERDEKIIQDESRDNFDAYSLIDPETAKKVAKTGLAVFAATSIIPLIIFVIVFCIIAFVIFKGVSTSVHEQQNKTQEEISKTIAINDVNKLKNTELKYLSDKSYSALSVKGEGGTKYSYQNEDHEVYKYIGAYKDKKNYIYVVQKVLYVNFFNVKDKKTVFIPVRYENVYSGIKWSDDETEEIVNGSVVDAPKYYLNKDPELYVRGGYATYEEFYNDKIDPLKADGYKITEK